jgi:hypothetical protein
VNGIFESGATVVSNPFWCAGKVDGSNLNILGSSGRVGFTVSRGNNQTAGVYMITFDIQHPSGEHYVINTTTQNNGNCKVWDSPSWLPKTTDFHIVSYAVNNTTPVNAVFHFSVIA